MLPQNITRGVHFQFHNQDLIQKFIGIEPLNTKQCLVCLSSAIIPPPTVSLLSLKDSKISCFD